MYVKVNKYAAYYFVVTIPPTVIQQWEQQQHQQSRTCSWEPLCCGALQSSWLQQLLRVGRSNKPGVILADQLHPQGGPLPKSAKPRSAQRHEMRWCCFVSHRGTNVLKLVTWLHAHHFFQCFSTHLLVLYISCGWRPVGYLSSSSFWNKSVIFNWAIITGQL